MATYVLPEEYRNVDITERGWFYDWCTKDNLNAALKKMQKALGKEWATNDKTIRSNYSRDQSTVKKVIPHIVALPVSTEEVAGVVKIANDHGIPIVTGSCRINQSGECIPRRGGLVIDLVRMDKILEIDEEGMTATVQPFVKWQDLQIEGEKFGLLLISLGFLGWCLVPWIDRGKNRTLTKIVMVAGVAILIFLSIMTYLGHAG